MKKWITLIFVLLLLTVSCQLTIESPALLRGFDPPATADEVVRFSQRAAGRSSSLHLETLGFSEQGRPIAALRFSADSEKDENKLRVLIFAQQHGNEQSSKEASLLLISDFAKGKHAHWLEFMDIWIVPQVNPDGSEVNERRNANGIDLNRDHIVLEASETRALRGLFHRTLPHVTVDIHEYQPFRESWEQFGGFKTFDVQVGVPTNPNVDEDIRTFALKEALPSIENHLTERGFSFHNYLVGPVPSEGRTRHSTVDFSDGRQSFAMLNTLSFIYEGINGRDGFVENLERRTFGQYEALMALLNFLYENHETARQLVESGREKLKNATPGQEVAIRMDHFPGDTPLLLPLLSSRTGNDTLVVVENFHPQVKPLAFASRPLGYLIPANDTLLTRLVRKHQIQFSETIPEGTTIMAAKTATISTRIDEELENRFPEVTFHTYEKIAQEGEYWFLPINQLHANLLVSLLEPQSMLGIAQRSGFEYLLKKDTLFPIKRVE